MARCRHHLPGFRATCIAVGATFRDHRVGALAGECRGAWPASAYPKWCCTRRTMRTPWSGYSPTCKCWALIGVVGYFAEGERTRRALARVLAAVIPIFTLLDIRTSDSPLAAGFTPALARLCRRRSILWCCCCSRTLRCAARHRRQRGALGRWRRGTPAPHQARRAIMITLSRPLSIALLRDRDLGQPVIGLIGCSICDRTCPDDYGSPSPPRCTCGQVSASSPMSTSSSAPSTSISRSTRAILFRFSICP